MCDYWIIQLFSHWSVSEAASEVLVPTLLFAWHRYLWLKSVLFTFFTVSCLLCDVKLILGWSVVFTVNPSMVQEIEGSGFPVALQNRVTVSPSRTVWFWGWVAKAGLSAKGKKSILLSRHPLLSGLSARSNECLFIEVSLYFWKQEAFKRWGWKRS